MLKEEAAILFNPAAGKGAAQKRKDRLVGLLRKWEVPCDLIVTRSADDLRTRTRESAGRYRALVAAGGDSTLQIMADELAKSDGDVDLGFIPLGSSNDIAREFGLTDLEKACRILKRGTTRLIDLGVVRHQGRLLHHFVGQVNIGLGVRVTGYVEEFAARWPPLASFQFLAGMLGVYRAYRRREVPLSLSVQAGDEECRGRFILAGFSNIRFWASGRILSPSAQPDDGRLDGCLVKDCSFLRLARLAALARRGRLGTAPEAAFLAGPAFRISSEHGFGVQLDGEVIGGYGAPRLFREIEVGTVPGKLRLIC